MSTLKTMTLDELRETPLTKEQKQAIRSAAKKAKSGKTTEDPDCPKMKKKSSPNSARGGRFTPAGTSRRRRRYNARGHRRLGVVQEPGKGLSNEDKRGLEGLRVRLKQNKKNFRQAA